MKKRNKAAILTAAIGAAINLMLGLVKLFVGLSTNSVTILTDSMNNFSDILGCGTVILAFALLYNQKDEKHPYGYGRAEYLAGFVTSAVITAVGGLFALESLSRFSMPTPVWFSWMNFGIIAVTAAVKLFMGRAYRRINKQIESAAIKALELDSYLDTGITVMTLISFMLMQYSGARLDSLFGLAISIMIIVSGVRLVKENGGILIGRGADRDQSQRAAAIALGEGASIAALKLHFYGRGAIVGTLEVTYKEGISANQILTADKRIEEKIRGELGWDVLVVPREVKNEKQRS